MNSVQWYSYTYIIIERQSPQKSFWRKKGEEKAFSLTYTSYVTYISEPIKICKIQKSRGKTNLKASLFFYL